MSPITTTQPYLVAETSRPGHTPTLIASFLHFDLSFMLWVLLGALGISIAESAGLSPSEKGLMVAVPVLSGSLLRIPLGILGDRVGGKRIGVAMLAFLFIPLAMGWLMGDGLPALLAIGLMLGCAGASFAVALPLASKWYPPQRQGLAMGIAAAGNSGTVIANLLAPRIAEAVGWHNVLGLAMLPLTLVLVAFVLLAKDAPRTATAPSLSGHLRALANGDMWWFCLLYSVTFGGYVGLSSFLPLFLRDQYALDPVSAGGLTALAAFVGSGIRPIGGYLADRVGGARLLSLVLIGIAATYACVSTLPPLQIASALLVAGMACFGIGNGSVFQLVPQRFGSQIGIATGMVGAIGGLGGFFLPILLGSVKESSGSFATGFVVLATFATLAVVALRALVAVENGWRVGWRSTSSLSMEGA
jgi:MFS transporter, NNP family, nitrate/nitrite transporter